MLHDPEILVCPVSDPIAGELVVCEVGNAPVVRCDPTELVRVFRVFGGQRDGLAKNAGKLLVGIKGYEGVPEEIYEIDEARAYLTELTNQVPWWLALIHPSLALTWLCSITPKAEVQRFADGKIAVRPDRRAIVQKTDQTISAATDHLHDRGVGEDIRETVQINLNMLRHLILSGAHQSQLDPYMEMQQRAARSFGM
jgi:hypothetical protein